MFTRWYFPGRFFAPRYWPEEGGEFPTLDVELAMLWEVQPTPSRVAAALYGERGVVRIDYRYEKRTPLNVFIEDVSDAILTCEIEGNNDRQVFRTARFRMHPREIDINPLADTIAVFADVLVDDGYVHPIPMGLFTLTFPDKTFEPHSHNDIWEIGASDLAIHLVDDTIDETYTIAAGENYISGTGAVKDLLDAHPLNSILPSTSLVLPAIRTWPPDTPKLQIINDLLHACNMYSLWFDENGVARTRTRDNLNTRSADFAYTGDDFVAAMPINERADTTRFANKIIAIVEDPNIGILRSVAVNSDPDSPTSTVSLGRTISKTMRPKAADQTTLDEIAYSELQQAASSYKRITLRTQPDPRRGAHEVMTLEVGDEYTGEKWWVRNWRISLAPGQPMQFTLAKVEKVEGS